MFKRKMSVIDLKLPLQFGHSYFLTTQEGVAYEYRKNDFLSGNGFPTAERIPQMCQTIPRRLQSNELFMLGSVSLDSLCPAYLQGESPRYRNLSSVDQKETLSYGFSRSRFPQYAGRRQRKPRLAYLCRLCSSTD